MSRFVLEIGTEELPARFLKPEQAALARILAERLAEEGLAYGEIKVFATPRRLGVIIEDLAENQALSDDLVIGPPAAIAYDAEGHPTRALLGFAAGNNIPPEEVFRHDTPKGEYAACRKKSGGRGAREVLAEILPDAIESIPFNKRMKWGCHRITHARPIRWILALLDQEVVPFKVGHIQSDRLIYGHRVHGPGPFSVPTAATYEEVLKDQCAVFADSAQRREMIVEQGDRLARDVNGIILWTDGLLDEVSGLVEHPVAILGDFDREYLDIPREVLLTSMEEHQKSFGVEDSEGNLLPHFLTVLNLKPQNSDLVKRGWEKVLKARLEDARFFWQSDLQESFDSRLQKLENVIFLGPLGSMADKGRRLSSLCQWLALELCPEDISAEDAARAGLLAKADLVSAMVGEFDTLQGIMGGIYAQEAGEPAAVSAAIREQYLPTGPESKVPASVGGAILSLADKADTLTGCFGLGLIPTGAADPNGLRRCALGMIRILIARNWHIDPVEIFLADRKLYKDINWKLNEQETMNKLREFFRGRLRNYFITQGYDTVLTDAVLGVGNCDPADAKARLDALSAFSKTPNYVQAAQLMKRIENIVRKSAADIRGDWEDARLEAEAEKNLALKAASIKTRLEAALDGRDYPSALTYLEELRPAVDAFFENVLVMSDDPQVRDNRLRLLQSLAAPFGKIARFSMLQV